MSIKKLIFGIAFFTFFMAPLTAPNAAETAIKGDKEMNRTTIMEKNIKKWLKDANDGMSAKDPELAAIQNKLLYGQILDHGSLNDKQRALIILASLAASQNFDSISEYAQAALNVGALPEEIKETLYQCAPYIGFPRVKSALNLVYALFQKNDLKIPPQNQATVTEETRFKDGLAVQKKIFGSDHIENMQKNAPQGQQDLVTNYLSSFCFGDFYTRKALGLPLRELITFSAIVSLGGCDPQAKAHAAANISVGNSKQNLVDALTVMLPFIGFPRVLNGLAAVNAALPEPHPAK